MAASAYSAIVEGAFSGSRPASLNRSLFQNSIDRSSTNGSTYSLPSDVPAARWPGLMLSLNGMASMLAVRSLNRPCLIQFGTYTMSAANRSGRLLEPAAAPTFAT